MAESGTNGRGSEELTLRQRKTIPHLVAASSRERGCKAARIGRSTLTEWLKQPAFAEALRSAEALAYREALATVQKATGEAAEVLRGLLASESEAIRLRAASELLAFSMKSRDAVEIEERLEAIEARMGGEGEEKTATTRAH